jgi:hypothetical protein
MAIANLLVRKVEPDAKKLGEIAGKAMKAAVGGGLGAAFMMGGKRMVMDRGRYKEAANVGSMSAKKASDAVKNVVSGVKAKIDEKENQKYIGYNRLRDAGVRGPLTDKEVERVGKERMAPKRPDHATRSPKRSPNHGPDTGTIPMPGPRNNKAQADQAFKALQALLKKK